MQITKCVSCWSYLLFLLLLLQTSDHSSLLYSQRGELVITQNAVQHLCTHWSRKQQCNGWKRRKISKKLFFFFLCWIVLFDLECGERRALCNVSAHTWPTVWLPNTRGGGVALWGEEGWWWWRWGCCGKRKDIGLWETAVDGWESSIHPSSSCNVGLIMRQFKYLSAVQSKQSQNTPSLFRKYDLSQTQCPYKIDISSQFVWPNWKAICHLEGTTKQHHSRGVVEQMAL